MAFTDLEEGVLGIFAEAQGRASLSSRQEQVRAALAKGYRLRVARKTRRDKGATRLPPEVRSAKRVAARRRTLNRARADPVRQEHLRRLAREAMARKRADPVRVALVLRDRVSYRARENADPERRARRLALKRAAYAARRAMQQDHPLSPAE